MMMNTGLMDWTQAAGISQPNRFRSSFSSEYTAMKVNCCWNRAQNAAEAMYSGMNAATRPRSVGVTFLLLKISAKYSTDAPIAA